MSSGTPPPPENEETTSTMLIKDNATSIGNKRSHSAVVASGPSPRRKKAKDMPRRPLSAYNIYFQEERKRTIAKHERGEPQDDFQLPDGRDPSEALFQALSRTVANRWKALPEDKRAPYHARAKEEMAKYREKMDEYNQKLINSSALARRLAAKQKEELDESEEEINPTSRDDAKTAATQGDRPAITPNPSAAFAQQDALLGSMRSLRSNFNAGQGQSLPPFQYGPFTAANSFHIPGQSSPFGLPSHPAALHMTPQERTQLLQSLHMGGTDLYSRMAPNPAISTLMGRQDSNHVARWQLEQARLNRFLNGGRGVFAPTGLQDYSHGLYGSSLGRGVHALYGISRQQQNSSAAAMLMERVQAEQRQLNEGALRTTTQWQMSVPDELALQQLLHDHPELARGHFGHMNKY